MDNSNLVKCEPDAVHVTSTEADEVRKAPHRRPGNERGSRMSSMSATGSLLPRKTAGKCDAPRLAPTRIGHRVHWPRLLGAVFAVGFSGAVWWTLFHLLSHLR
jgi:hypothetical protein